MIYFALLLPVILKGSLGLNASPRKPAKLPVPISIVRVIDGDTLIGEIDRIQTRVRLCGVDAPEKKQLLGSDARQMLTTLVSTGTTTVVPVSNDQYGRMIGSLYVNNNSVQAKMAIQGLAYYYKSQGVCPDKAEIIAADNYARNNRIGMRGVPGFVPPWEYRRRVPPRSWVDILTPVASPDPIFMEPLLVWDN